MIAVLFYCLFLFKDEPAEGDLLLVVLFLLLFFFFLGSSRPAAPALDLEGDEDCFLLCVASKCQEKEKGAP